MAGELGRPGREASGLERLGREVARLEDEALARRAPPPVAVRLAWLRGASARRRAPERPGRRGFVWAAALGSVAAAFALALVARGRFGGGESLRFEVGAGRDPGQLGAWVSASPAGELPVSFSDGTSLRLTPDARARVTSVSDRGAHVVVERGRVNFDVVPRPVNEWTVTLGPFDVRVTGTRFDASWDPVAEVFELAMQEGAVRVSGACMAATRTAKKGETLRFSCHDAAASGGARSGRAEGGTAEGAAAARAEPAPPEGGEGPAGAPTAAQAEAARPDAAGGVGGATGITAGATTESGAASATAGITAGVATAGSAAGVKAADGTATAGTARGERLGPEGNNPGSSSPPGPASPRPKQGDEPKPSGGAKGAPSAAAPAVSAADSAAPLAALPPPPPLPWQALAMTGDYRGALAAVEREGFDSVVASANVADLKRLGELSRLAKAPGRARAAYEALRRRVPGSDMAAVAAFELGRIAFDESRSFGDARRWFATYLSERPQGSLAQEALGRLVEAHHRAGDREAARAAAQTYLARYPQGPHATLAGELARP